MFCGQDFSPLVGDSFHRTYSNYKSNFQVPNINFRVLNTIFQVPNTTFRVPNTNFRVPNTNFRVPNTTFRVPNTIFRVPNTTFGVPNTIFRVSISKDEHISLNDQLRNSKRLITNSMRSPLLFLRVLCASAVRHSSYTHQPQILH
ncbi:hypothetical protein [uncultured Nostoc sp.]|uniref:hypothetical protein n=1 Tax=uncultured Nostoc sp. TaxID=340711 RepID=UPI00260FA4F3|nr:hypothetical protein [uncultured Nostoc sp.]